MKPTKPSIKPELKIADNFLDLRTQETNVIVQHLEEQIRLRELPLEKQIQKSLRKQSSRNE